MKTEYNVAVSHPTNFHSGTHTLTVTANQNVRYVSGSDFGCSRDYLTDSDHAAIRLFMAEHACVVVSIRSVMRPESGDSAGSKPSKTQRNSHPNRSKSMTTQNNAETTTATTQTKPATKLVEVLEGNDVVVKKVAAKKPAAKKTDKKTDKTATKPAAKATAKPGDKLRAPQVKILECLHKAGKPMTRQQIIAKTELDSAWMGTWIGSPVLEVRKASDAKYCVSLVTLGLVKVEVQDVDGKDLIVQSITAKGREALKKAK